MGRAPDGGGGQVVGYVKLDEGFAYNAKVIAAGNAAAGAFARALAWCSANRSDGFVPKSVACTFASSSLRKRMASVRLWAEVEPGDIVTIRDRIDSGRRPLPDVEIAVKAHGYYIRDYLIHNRATTDGVHNAVSNARAESAQTRALLDETKTKTTHPPSSTVRRAGRRRRSSSEVPL